MDNFTMSENFGSFGMQQRQDRFDAIGDLIVGPPGPPGPQGPPGADGTVSFDELTPAQRESLRGEGVAAGGTTGQVLAKASNTDYDTEWVDQSGGGGTSDYTDLTNKPSINNVTLSGNKTAAQLGLATPSDIPTVPVQSVNNKTGAVVLSASDVSALPLAGGTMSGNIDMGSNRITNLPTPTHYLDAANKNYVDTRYIKPASGIPKSDLASAVQTSLGKADTALQAVPSTYRTAAAQDAIDAAQDATIGVVITGNRPSMAVTAGQYVIVRNSTISGITDGLYTANAALSPSTDVTAANLTAVSNGGFNDLQSQFTPYEAGYTDFNSSAFQLESWGRIYVYVSGHVCIIGITGLKPISTLSANTAVCKLPFVSKSAVMVALTNGGKAFIQLNNNTIYATSGISAGTELNGQLAILI